MSTITKSELLSELSEHTGLSKSDLNKLFDTLEEIVHKHIKNNEGITIPNLCKIYVHKKAATTARQMKSPLTGAMIHIPAKPARKVVKVKAVKNLKDMI
jgi:nucleoid DNA-binding protein